MTKQKLKVCCVARAVFSFPDSCFHGTWPSSLNGVTLRRAALKVLPVAGSLCVACERRCLAMHRIGFGATATATLLVGRSIAEVEVVSFIVGRARCR